MLNFIKRLAQGTVLTMVIMAALAVSAALFTSILGMIFASVKGAGEAGGSVLIFFGPVFMTILVMY